MKLKNKIIAITGAGRGIGRGLAIKLSNEGAKLILLARTESELKVTHNLVIENSPDSVYKLLDVSSKENVIKVFDELYSEIGNIDVLINNAGIQPPIGAFYTNSLDEWEKNISINLLGTIFCTNSVLPKMIDTGKGKIINFSGGGATGPRANFSAYASSKVAVVRFTETLAEEITGYNIDVNSVAPGAINTKMLFEVIDSKELAGNEFNDALKRKDNGGNDPKFVEDLMVFLASDESDGISGKLISAVWDPWQEKSFQQALKNDKDFCTLRRIDNKFYTKKI